MTNWLLRVSESRWNYWTTYAVDLSLMSFLVAWDALRVNVSGGRIVGLYLVGLLTWTLTEYVFHRWVYHLEWGIFRHGHDLHHEKPKAYIAMPFFVTPMLFIPLQLLVTNYFGVHGFGTFVGGWFGGFIAYGFFHHSLHHYKLRFAWYRHLQSQHRIHHAFPETNFGVTMRYWDRVFRTEFTKDR